MLECDQLRIDPWTPWAGEILHWPGPLPVWVRRIADPTSGRILGLASWPATNLRFWNRWWGRRLLEITETEDASLLARLHRGWLQPWDVLDAEDRWVGTFYRHTLVDGIGRRIDLIRRSDSLLFLDDARREIAAWSTPSPCTPGTLRFEFLPRFDPFRRMALLAAVLVQDPLPRRFPSNSDEPP